MNDDLTFEPQEAMFFPQDPSKGPCKMELQFKVFNPDGRGIEIKIPHIVLEPEHPMVLWLGNHIWDDEDQRQGHFIGIDLPAAEMMPEGIVEHFILALIDPPTEEKD